MTLAKRISTRLLVCAAVPLGHAAVAQATQPTAVLTQTAQAQQANATFLAYAPQPAGGAGALCLVDTGVNPTPDTTPGLIGSYAIDNGPSGDVSADGHGTTMAMIAGGAGKGILGVWPALKIVSVRATNVPSVGQDPQFGFWDYSEGMASCLEAPSADQIKAVDLALASPIPPTPDQVQTFASAVDTVEGQNVAVVAAAGNTPGAVEEPGAEPNVLSVGADTAQPGTFSDTPPGTICSFSADQSVGLYAPGCGLDAADPFSDQPLCCDDGTSEASAFTAAVIVALMSYDPTLTYSHAEQLLISTANAGDLDVAAAFNADGLGQIVTEGNANTPAQPSTTTTPTTPTSTTTTPSATPPITTPTGKAATHAYPVSVTAVGWHHGILTIHLTGMAKHDTVRVTLNYTHRRTRRTGPARATITLRTRRPRSVVVRVFNGHKPLSTSTTVRL